MGLFSQGLPHIEATDFVALLVLAIGTISNTKPWNSQAINIFYNITKHPKKIIIIITSH